MPEAITEYQPQRGDQVTWLFSPRGSDEVHPLPAEVYSVGPKIVTLRLTLIDKTTVLRRVQRHLLVPREARGEA